MLIARTFADLVDARASLEPHSVSLVPTMGALHEGHLALVHAGRAHSEKVVASIFVNPLQFELAAELDSYPVNEERDLEMLRQSGCALVWLPTPDVMYPFGHATTIDVKGPAEPLEGVRRPGHFRGVATVVAKLLIQTRPDIVWLGEKDWQQMQVVRRMVADLFLPVAIRSVQTVRASDGLALSSRNRLLSPEQRRIAPLLHETLISITRSMLSGVDVPSALANGRASLTQAGFDVEYLLLADAETLSEVGHVSPGCRLVTAARLSGVRLIDNVSVPAER